MICSLKAFDFKVTKHMGSRSDTMRKRNLSEKQFQTRIKINEKMMYNIEENSIKPVILRI